jgi:signal peptidase II
LRPSTLAKSTVARDNARPRAVSAVLAVPPAAEPINTPVKHWLWLSAAVLVLDQLSKWLVLAAIEPYQVIELVPNLNLTLMFNTGAAFSLLSDAGGWQRWLFAGFAVAVTVALLVWLLRLKPGEGWLAVGLSLILGGAVGNLIDRVLLGHVVDFIQVYLPFLPFAMFNPWPSFNVADSAISVGVVLLLIESFRAQRHTDGAAAKG